MAYATVDDVVLLVPSLDGTPAADAAEAVLEGASRFIDNYTGRTWVSGTVTGEVLTVQRGEVRTKRYPVTAVVALSVRSPLVGATTAVLTATVGYDLLDPSRGRIAISAVDGSLVTVTYTMAPVVPDDIKQATAMLAAHWASSAVDASGSIFSKIKAGSAELTYRDPPEYLPVDIKAILDGYRPAFAFA